MPKKVVANGDDDATFLSPRTFARHDEMAAYVLGSPRTDAPPGDRNRFPWLSPGAWGLLASGDTITGASGTTLGTGSVKLCDSSGTAYSPDVSADVKNAGSAITTSGGDRLLPLEWVLGDWTACGGTSGGFVPGSCDACFGTGPPWAPLTVTDGSATFTVTGVSIYPQQWSGGYTLPETGVDTVTPFGPGYVYTTGPITLAVGYSISCGGGSTPKLIVSRGWGILAVNSPDVFCGSPPVPGYEYIDVSLLSNNYCLGSPFGVNPSGDSAVGILTIDQCGPLHASGLLPTGPHHTPDPSPGTVTVTTTSREEMVRWLDSGDPVKVRHATYRLAVFEDPGVVGIALLRDGTWAGRLASPTAEDVALQRYLEQHGCGGCGG